MTTHAQPIGEYIEVGRRFRRSVNIERDYRGALQNGDYIVTPTAREVLHRLAEGLANGSHSRAWTVTGPYGVGKSAFAVFLTRLFCSGEETGATARGHIKKVDPKLAIQLGELKVCRDNGKGMLPILVTARRAPAPRCIAEGIVSALSSEKSKTLKAAAHKLAVTLGASKNGDSLDTRWVVSALQMATESAREAGHTGVLLIIDELGKLFEYSARYPQKGDVFVLQELAEHAARSNDFPTILVGLLHQSFEEYGHHLDIGTRREWAKIQGRFGDVAFLEPAEQVIKMVAEAIRWKTAERPRGFNAHVSRVVTAAAALGVAPPGMPLADFEATALAAYPLHPLTLIALPYLFRRFAQNERSLFSYLSSMEPYGFQEIVKTRLLTSSAPPFVRLSDLFDYFTSNFGVGLYRQPHALRWLEATDVLERHDELGQVNRDVVKTIGVLNALGQFCHLTASSGLISLALQDSGSSDEALQRALSELKESSVLTYRNYNHTYRIWEGSDVDIEERIAEGERKVQRALGLADSVRGGLASRPMVARRHSFETGALRSFEVIYVDSPQQLDTVIASKATLDGKIVVCLAESTTFAEQFQVRTSSAHDNKNVLFAIPQQIGELRGAVTELGALRWVWENTPELRDDRVARREVSLRITEAEQLLLRNLNGLVDPRPEPVGSGCLWFYTGKQESVRTSADVSQLLSTVCDQIYSESPKIRNELIVRRSLSSAAAAARRNLVQAMLDHAKEPMLGIEGYPPERSMYESVLAATGLYRVQENGEWGFAAPTRSPKHNLLPCWKHLTDLVFNRQPEPLPLTALFGELARPPYGVLDGLQPVLLCAFMKVHPDETTLYREGTFLPEPSIADFEIMMRRPEMFAIAGSRVEGGRAAVVERLAKGLKVKAATVPVVRALFQMVKGLPEFAWRTQRLSKTTVALRQAFENAKSPERFLFMEVPAALGFQVFSYDKILASEVNQYFDALNGCLQEWAGGAREVHGMARDALLTACGLGTGEPGWQELRQACLQIESSVTEPQLVAFVNRVVQAGPGIEGIDSVLALMANRPPHSWADADVERFPKLAKTLGDPLRRALVGLSGESYVALADLAPNQRERAKSLARDLGRKLNTSQHNTTPEIMRAALLLIADELAKKTRSRK